MKGWIPFAFRIALIFLYDIFNKVLKKFLRDFGVWWTHWTHLLLDQQMVHCGRNWMDLAQQQYSGKPHCSNDAQLVWRCSKCAKKRSLRPLHHWQQPTRPSGCHRWKWDWSGNILLPSIVQFRWACVSCSFMFLFLADGSATNVVSPCCMPSSSGSESLSSPV